MQKCTSFLRLSASLPDKWLMPAMSIQKLVVRAVNAESALEKAAAMMPMVKNISTANPRWPSAANKGSISSPAAGRGMFSCEANNNSRIPSDRNRKLTGTNRHLLVIKGGNKQLDCTPPHDVPLQPFRPLMVKAEVPEAQETAGLINNLILASQELLADHPVNQKRIAEGKDPANSIWPWSPGYRPQMEPLSGKYPAIKKGAVISAVDLINGIGHYAGLRRIAVEGATGLYNTNYENKVAAALEALKTDDFVYLHIEASDEAGHEGDFKLKQFTIENLDKRVVRPVYEAVKDWDEPVAIAVLPDHPTPCELRTHTAEPVPFLIYYPGIEPDCVQTFDEVACVEGSYGILKEDEFMNEFMKK